MGSNLARARDLHCFARSFRHPLPLSLNPCLPALVGVNNGAVKSWSEIHGLRQLLLLLRRLANVTSASLAALESLRTAYPRAATTFGTIIVVDGITSLRD